MQPKLSWIPLRCVNGMVETAWPTRQAVLRQAHQDLGLQYVEIHHAVVRDGDPHDIADVKSLLRWYKLKCSWLVCAPDLAHPAPEQRAEELALLTRKLETAQAIGAEGLRVTAGQAHPGTLLKDGLRWAADALASLRPAAEGLGLRLVVENHYKDPRWTLRDLCARADAFLELLELLGDAPIGISFNCSAPLVALEDPVELLQRLGGRVWNVHVSDRLPEMPAQTVLGDGMADLDGVLMHLASSGYDGYLCFEDWNPEGNRGTQRSVEYLRDRIGRYWPEPTEEA